MLPPNNAIVVFREDGILANPPCNDVFLLERWIRRDCHECTRVANTPSVEEVPVADVSVAPASGPSVKRARTRRTT